MLMLKSHVGTLSKSLNTKLLHIIIYLCWHSKTFFSFKYLKQSVKHRTPFLPSENGDARGVGSDANDGQAEDADRHPRDALADVRRSIAHRFFLLFLQKFIFNLCFKCQFENVCFVQLLDLFISFLCQLLKLVYFAFLFWFCNSFFTSTLNVDLKLFCFWRNN